MCTLGGQCVIFGTSFWPILPMRHSLLTHAKNRELLSTRLGVTAKQALHASLNFNLRFASRNHWFRHQTGNVLEPASYRP